MEKKISHIENQEIIIGSYIDYRMEETVVKIKKYVAEYKQQDVYVHITGEGVGKEEFVGILRQLIHLNLDK